MVDFLIIGPVLNGINKNMFPLIKDGILVFGWNNVVEFENSVKFGNIGWFTNLDCERPSFLELKKYVEGDYKKFDKYNAINVDNIKDIPDYDGVMGVPVTFLEKWNPGQFEIVDILKPKLKKRDTLLDGVYLYSKILIKRKK